MVSACQLEKSQLRVEARNGVITSLYNQHDYHEIIE